MTLYIAFEIFWPLDIVKNWLIELLNVCNYWLVSKSGKNAGVVYRWSPTRMEAAEALQFSQEKAIIFNWIMCLLEPTVSFVCISTSETN